MGGWGELQPSLFWIIGNFVTKKIQKHLEVGGSRSHLDNFFWENRPKIKFCVCTIRPCLAVAFYPVFCDFVIVHVLRFD